MFNRYIISLLIPLAATAGVLGQSPSNESDAKRSASLAAVVPADAGLFVELRGVLGSDPRSRDDSAERLYTLLVGSESLDSADVRAAFLSGLGLENSEDLRELFSHQLAVAAPSWRSLAEGVIVVRLHAGSRLVRDVFAPDRVETMDRKNDVAVFRTRSRLSAATNGDVLIISQRNHDASLYRKMVRILLNEPVDSLVNDATYLAQTADLPSDHDGVLYVRLDVPEQGREASDSLLASLSRLAVGIQFRPQHVDFSVHASRTNPVVAPRATSLSLERLKNLPLTTLAAWHTEIDVRNAFRVISKRQQAMVDSPHLGLLMRIVNLDEFERDVLDHLGPGALVTWDQNLGAGPEIPQLAIQLASDDSVRCAERIADAIQTVVNWFDIKNRGLSGRKLRLSRTHYLGTQLYEISLPNEPDPASEWDVLGGIRPAFAAVADSLVLALSADQIRSIIDARVGLAPTLASLRDWVELGGSSKPAALFGMAQPVLAGQVVDRWLSSPDSVMSRWLTQGMVSTHDAETRTPTALLLGIGAQRGDSPGTLKIARVYSNGRTHGYLRPDDVIHGINGSLLSLSHPTEDLRRIAMETAAKGSWVFRVQRDGEFTEVAVPVRGITDASADPKVALRQLQSLFRQIDFGSIRAEPTQANGLRAHVTVRFNNSKLRG